MKTLFTILLLPLTLFGQVFPSGGGGGTGAASNWSASGTTNSTLAGTAYLNSLVATNSIQTLSTNGGYLEMASITAPISVPPSGSLSLFPTNGGFGYMNSAGTVTMFAAGGGAVTGTVITNGGSGLTAGVFLMSVDNLGTNVGASLIQQTNGMLGFGRSPTTYSNEFAGGVWGSATANFSQYWATSRGSTNAPAIANGSANAIGSGPHWDAAGAWAITYQTNKVAAFGYPTMTNYANLVVLSNISGINGVGYTWPSAQGATGQVLTNDGSGNLKWGTISGGGASLVQPVTDFRFKLGSQLASIDAAWSTNHVLFFDDFLSVNPTPSALGWSFELSGGSVNPLTTYTTNHFGQFYISSGTATGNYADVRLSFSSIPISPGVSYFYELSARCFALAGSGNTNHVRIGFGNQTGATEFTSGIWIDLNATNSVNWRLGTVAGGAITYSDSGVAADTSWHSLGFLVGAGGSQVALYIDGVSKCTNTTAIPTGISNLMGPVQENNWVSGSGASLVIDAARFGWCQH